IQKIGADCGVSDNPPRNSEQVLANYGQVHPVMTLLSNVTAPFRASALPSRFTPVVTVIDVSAKMFPLNIEFVPRVAELPTCQKTLQADAPLAKTIWLPLPVVSVDAIWKMNTASGLP